MLNIDAPLFLVLASLTAPPGAAGHAPSGAAGPAPCLLAQTALRGVPPTPPPPPPQQQQPQLRGRPPAPPPPPVERVAPRPGFVWIEGNYDWRDGRYVWTGGHWEAERRGRHWHGGRYDWQGDRYVWIRGDWDDGPAYVAPPKVIIETPPPAPPPPPQALPPPPPQGRPGFVWVPGNQEWRDGRYVWVEGHWEPEHRGHRWQQGHWDRDGDRNYWHPSEWRREAPPMVTISGRVVSRRGRPMGGVTVVLAGTSEARAVTGPDGSYSFTGLGPGSYAVRPTAGNCGFAPDVVNLNNLAGPVVQDFNAACNWH